ncbi:MAG: N-acetyltransferase [Novosphingobium sp.]|nr:N-acetyltransferase [Novosphingobium sp.]
MTNEVTITSLNQGGAGEYHAAVAGNDAVGRLTWVARGEAVRAAEHTIVPPEIGGRGVAGKLVQAMIADAREHGFRIAPVCSYVVAAFEKHPEWADVRA